VLRGLFQPKKEEVKEWRKRHNEEFQIFTVYQILLTFSNQGEGGGELNRHCT
jgi:hypothetical protein